MRRRTLLASTGAALATGLAGCSTETDESDDGVGGGVRIDYDEAVNRQEGKTYIDIELKTWFNCSGYTSTPDDEVTITVEVRALGQVQASENWTVTYDDCMNQQTRTVGFVLEQEYDDILISTSHDKEGQ